MPAPWEDNVGTVFDEDGRSLQTQGRFGREVASVRMTDIPISEGISQPAAELFQAVSMNAHEHYAWSTCVSDCVLSVRAVIEEPSAFELV